MTHELKILPKWFEDVCAQKKTFEIRKNDRDYNVGDTLILKEWYGGKYTGREVKRTVSYIYYGDGCYGLSDEYVVMAIRGARVVLDEGLYNFAHSILMGCPSVEPESKWIPCITQLPKYEGFYLVTKRRSSSLLKCPEYYIDIAGFKDGNWGYWGEIVAWMPLPEPYKAESEEV